jgi:hypothetical protein
MPTTSPEITERFNRSRRNLILISLLILFSQFAGGLTLKELNVFGNRTVLANPIELETILWIGLIYLAWRYYQYFHYSEEKGIVVGKFFERRKDYLKAILEGLPELLDSIKATYQEEIKSKDQIKSIHIGDIDVLKQFAFHTEVKFEDVKIKHEDGSIGHQIGQIPRVIKGRDLIIPNIRSVLYVVFRTPLFTEYYFPFVVATLPVIKHFW